MTYYPAIEQYKELSAKSKADLKHAHARLLRLERKVFKNLPHVPEDKELDPTTLLARLDRLEAAMSWWKYK